MLTELVSKATHCVREHFLIGFPRNQNLVIHDLKDGDESDEGDNNSPFFIIDGFDFSNLREKRPSSALSSIFDFRISLSLALQTEL